jgi:hypothetical protein
MTDTGRIKHSDDLGGAFLKLSGLTDGHPTLRVYAGPREQARSCGEVTAYSTVAGDTPAGHPVATMRATPDLAGAMSLRVRTDGRLYETVEVSGGTREDPSGRIALRDANGPTRQITAYLQGELDDGPAIFVQDGWAATWLRPSGIEVFGGQKNFVAPHPGDSGLALYYCSLEGPEAGTYIRGTARLVAGKAEVLLPEHFGLVTSEHGLTVQLTPRSPRSRGVCASSLSTGVLQIEELSEGTGDYEVDYLVHGIRKGMEEYRVIRPRPSLPAPRRG